MPSRANWMNIWMSERLTDCLIGDWYWNARMSCPVTCRSDPQKAPKAYIILYIYEQIFIYTNMYVCIYFAIVVKLFHFAWFGSDCSSHLFYNMYFYIHICKCKCLYCTSMSVQLCVCFYFATFNIVSRVVGIVAFCSSNQQHYTHIQTHK